MTNDPLSEQGENISDRLPSCHRTCREEIVTGMAALGVEVNASHVPPLFDRGYEPLNMRCPHGVRWFMEPTNDQIARYHSEGVL